MFYSPRTNDWNKNRINCKRIMKNWSKSKLHYKHDTPEMTAMIDAYNNRIPGTDYREAVAETCRVCIAKITPPYQAIRYAEAMDRRDFIFDVLLEEAEFYLIGGGNG